jgi:D-beta-D-heptose 7-phosphate kinase/D-beta-D-heptose 1-phosphate adenosyltransferase
MPDRVVSRAVARVRVAGWRRRGLTVVFTNGVFDLLHPGHVRTLRAARARGDALVVGLNSDASVRRLKGPGRPVQPLRARAAVLAALRDVDLVVPFSEDTPLELIRALRPQVLVKGADYGAGEIVGEREVLGWGGRVVRVGLHRGPLSSTTRLLEKAVRRPRRVPAK